MGQIFCFMICIQIVFKLAFASPGVEVDVKLSPAGSFKATTSKIKGIAKQKGNLVASSNIMVDLRSLSTGIALRDKHLKQRLLVEAHPVAKLSAAKGKDGKGEATLSIMGTTHKISGTYKTQNDFLISEFKMKLSSLGIKDVNYMGVGVKDEVVVKATVPLEQVIVKNQAENLKTENGE